MRTLARRIPWLSVLLLAFWGVASAQTQGSSSQNPTNKSTTKSTTSKPATTNSSGAATKTSTTSKPATTSASTTTKTSTTSKPATTTSTTTAKSSTTAQGDNKNGGAKDDFKQVGSDTAGAGKATGSAFKKLGTKVGSGTKNTFNRVVGKDDNNDKDDKNKDDKNKDKDQKGPSS